MTLESMSGIHITLFNLLTVTDKMFSEGYITASADVIGPADDVADLAVHSTQSLYSLATGTDLQGHD